MKVTIEARFTQGALGTGDCIQPQAISAQMPQCITETHSLVAAQIFPAVSFGENIVTKECNCYGHYCSSNIFFCCQGYGSFLILENEPPKIVKLPVVLQSFF